MQIKARRVKRCAWPPIGGYSTPPPPFKDFEAIRIKPFKPFRLRPEGVRQSQTEANILGRIAAIQQNRAMSGGDILSR